MVGLKPTDLAPTATVKFFGAGTAACIADLVTFPLDTAKVRLQVSGRFILMKFPFENYSLRIISTAELIINIMRDIFGLIDTCAMHKGTKITTE